MLALDRLTHALAAEPSLEASLSILLATLAQEIKATSNDQNIQKLARELKAAAPALVTAIAAKRIAMATG